MNTFTEIELDALAELTNIGIGRAAAALSDLVNQEIKLSVPKCVITSKPDAVKHLNEQIETNAIGVKETFSGGFTGEGLLLFPQKDSLELVRSLVPEQTSLETLTEFEQDALIEIGNIILNACIGTYSNLLKQSLSTEIPYIVKGNCQSLVSPDNERKSDEDKIIMLDVSFAIDAGNIKGYVVFVMGIESEEHFRNSIDNYMEELAITA